jgi:hypothetical protein
MVIIDSRPRFQSTDTTTCFIKDPTSTLYNPSGFKEFIIIEFGVKTLPPLLFFILGTLRYFTIKDYAVGHCKYSNFFKAKVGISLLVGIFDIVQTIMTVITQPNSPHASIISACDLKWLASFYVF